MERQNLIDRGIKMNQKEVTELCKKIDKLEISMEKNQVELNNIRNLICAMKNL